MSLKHQARSNFTQPDSTSVLDCLALVIIALGYPANRLGFPFFPIPLLELTIAFACVLNWLQQRSLKHFPKSTNERFFLATFGISCVSWIITTRITESTLTGAARYGSPILVFLVLASFSQRSTLSYSISRTVSGKLVPFLIMPLVAFAVSSFLKYSLRFSGPTIPSYGGSTSLISGGYSVAALVLLNSLITRDASVRVSIKIAANSCFFIGSWITYQRPLVLVALAYVIITNFHVIRKTRHIQPQRRHKFSQLPWAAATTIVIILVIAFVPTRFNVSGFGSHYRLLSANVSALVNQGKSLLGPELVDTVKPASSIDHREPSGFELEGLELDLDEFDTTELDSSIGHRAASGYEPTNVHSRVEWTTSALRKWSEAGSPIIFGIGFDADLNNNFSTTERVTFIHNDGLEIFFRQGVIGFLLFAMFFYLVAKYFYNVALSKFQFVLGIAYVSGTMATQVTFYFTFWSVAALYVGMRFSTLSSRTCAPDNDR